MPGIARLSLFEGADRASGLAVVVDVLRAGSFVCTAFSRGASRVIAVDDLDAARRIAAGSPGFILSGERGGLSVEGFDLSNSPVELENLDLRGRTLVHTTGAGTQGLVRASRNASMVVMGAFVNASATARLAAAGQAAGGVSIVCMGREGREPGEEDEAFGDYLEALLVTGGRPDPTPFLDRARRSKAASFFIAGDRPGAPSRDLDLCLDLDRFDMVPVVSSRHDGYPVLVPERPGGG